jgi:hypothetical protein
VAIRWGWRAALAISAVLVAGGADSAPKHPPKSINPANDDLVKLSPPDQAARLARAVGNWCIGTEAFLMGLVTSGRGEGNAYWSLRCADGTAWAVQVDPLAEVTAIDCASFKDASVGKECFKKF